ncbi:MAG: hypothetical protein WBA74_04260 [Cyclobacteriaceae bacterium]
MNPIEISQMNPAVKYKMISKIINSKDDTILNQIKVLLGIEDDIDFWDELSNEDQAAINEGIAHLDNGQHISHQSVQEDIKKRFNF